MAPTAYSHIRDIGIEKFIIQPLPKPTLKKMEDIIDKFIYSKIKKDSFINQLKSLVTFSNEGVNFVCDQLFIKEMTVFDMTQGKEIPAVFGAAIMYTPNSIKQTALNRVVNDIETNKSKLGYKVDINFNLYLDPHLFKGLMTSREIVASIIHELGHTTSIYNSAVEAIYKGISSEFSSPYQNKISYSVTSAAILVSAMSIFLLPLAFILQISLLDKISNFLEKAADDYVSKAGYTTELISGLEKVAKAMDGQPGITKHNIKNIIRRTKHMMAREKYTEMKNSNTLKFLDKVKAKLKGVKEIDLYKPYMEAVQLLEVTLCGIDDADKLTPGFSNTYFF